jgi:hypothetical protein
LIVMCVLLFLTPIFKLMPYNTMGAIIIVGECANHRSLDGHCICQSGQLAYMTNRVWQSWPSVCMLLLRSRK